jgi:hypothetical protein
MILEESFFFLKNFFFFSILYFRDNKIGDKGAASLSESFKSLSKCPLTNLTISLRYKNNKQKDKYLNYF